MLRDSLAKVQLTLKQKQLKLYCSLSQIEVSGSPYAHTVKCYQFSKTAKICDATILQNELWNHSTVMNQSRAFALNIPDKNHGKIWNVANCRRSFLPWRVGQSRRVPKIKPFKWALPKKALPLPPQNWLWWGNDDHERQGPSHLRSTPFKMSKFTKQAEG